MAIIVKIYLPITKDEHTDILVLVGKLAKLAHFYRWKTIMGPSKRQNIFKNKSIDYMGYP